MTGIIEFAYNSNIGKRRENNEDNFWCYGDYLPAMNTGTAGTIEGRTDLRERPVFAVFDGMGGESCGEMAAWLSADAFGKFRQETDPETIPPEEYLSRVSASMNDAVCRYAAGNRIDSMASTAAMALFVKKGLWIANLGDSRIYKFSKNILARVSVDHVMEGWAFGKPPITQYLGFDEEDTDLSPFIRKVDIQEGDRFLLCTDGLTDMLKEERIREIMAGSASCRDAADQLTEDSLLAGGRDNITVMVLEVRHLRLSVMDRLRGAFGDRIMSTDQPIRG